MLHKWIIMPLKELKPIQERLGMVEYLVQHDDLLQEFLSHIKPIGDLERLISKVGLQKAGHGRVGRALVIDEVAQPAPFKESDTPAIGMVVCAAAPLRKPGEAQGQAGRQAAVHS